MDGERFDAIARLLAGGIRRRQALKAALGIGAATVATRVVINEAQACEPFGEFCDDHTPCCDPHVCILKTCSHCIKEGHTFCNVKSDCCKGNLCNGGKCEKDPDAKCDGNGCKKKKKRRKKKH